MQEGEQNIIRVSVADGYRIEEIPTETGVRKAAEVYKIIQDSISFLKIEAELVASVLIDAQAQEYFDDGTKVVYQEGKAKNELDERSIAAELTYDELLKVAKIQEKELKNLSRPDDERFGERLLANNKKTVDKGASSVKLAKMTKRELKEAGIE